MKSFAGNLSFTAALAALLILSAAGCEGEEAPAAAFYSDFECGSIGTVEELGPQEWRISLKNDNDDASLDDAWRSWWYVRMENASTREPTVITLANRGWPEYYVPVFSYDRETWQHFSESEVTQPAEYELRMEKTFEQPTVWLARFFPYTHTDLVAYLEGISGHGAVTSEMIGLTAQGREIVMLTITDPGTPDAGKRRIWIHARTHPAEIGASFAAQGLIDFLLGGSADANAALSNFIFHVVPMHNIDGVVIGNQRTTPRSENLESMWFFDPGSPETLTDEAPPEVQALHAVILDIMGMGLGDPGDPDDDSPITVALNLHSAHTEPDARAFFIPHFGPDFLGYEPDEVALWDSQYRFMTAAACYHDPDLMAPVPLMGNETFLETPYPETWWWANVGPAVMAITLETTLGRAGYAPRWITPDDMRSLGAHLVPAIMAYHDVVPTERTCDTPLP